MGRASLSECVSLRRRAYTQGASGLAVKMTSGFSTTTQFLFVVEGTMFRWRGGMT